MNTLTEKQYLFESMPVRKSVLKLILPSIISQMILLIYNLADTYFVGLLNDPTATAAVTISYPAFVMLTAVSNLFAIGGASLLARSLGKKDEDSAKNVSAIAFWFGLCAAIVFSACFALLSRPILTVCGATDATYNTTFSYARWVIIFGGIGAVINVLLSNLVRSEGSSVIAAIGVSLGGVLNIILDPVFVLPEFLNLGAEGAGIATALSNYFAVLFLLIATLVRHKRSVISFSPARLKTTAKYIKEIIMIGIPSAVQYALTVVAVAALSKFVSGYSTEAVAALGIVKKLDQLPLYFSIGVANGLLPLLAYNHSAGNQKRRRQAFLFGTVISLGFSLLCVLVFELFAPQLTGLFIQDEATVAYSTVFLRMMVLAMPMMSICYPMICQFQAMKKVKESLICSILRKGILDIPLLFLMNALFPLYGCMTVQPIVDSISLIACLILYRRVNRKEEAMQIPQIGSAD